MTVGSGLQVSLPEVLSGEIGAMTLRPEGMVRRRGRLSGRGKRLRVLDGRDWERRPLSKETRWGPVYNGLSAGADEL